MSKVLIKDLFGKNSLEGDVGIEIEVEAAGQLPNINTKWWSTKGDNSLRNGLEYVTKGALPVDSKKFERIKRLTDNFKPETKVDKNSHRTSIHVHRNVREKDILEVWVLITVGWLFENVLFKYCGPGREGNLFCLRLKDAEGVLKYVANDISAGSFPFAGLETDSIRYSSQNLSAIPIYGSIEYRGMQGTVDPTTIDVWSTGLFEMGENANKFFSTPEAVLDYYFKNGWEKLARLLFSGPLLEFILNVKNAGDLVEESALNLTSVAYATNWASYHARALKTFGDYKPPKKKEVNIGAMAGQGGTLPTAAEALAMWNEASAPQPRVRATRNRFEDMVANRTLGAEPNPPQPTTTTITARPARPWTLNVDF